MQRHHRQPDAGPPSTTSLPPPEPFPLLRLPREIRDQIYLSTLLAPGQTPISRARSRPFFKDYPTLPLNSLLVLANRQVHSEGSLVLYGENVFEFGSTDWFYAWFRAIGATHQPLVRRLLIYSDALGYFGWAKALWKSGMGGLREVCIIGHLSIEAYRIRHWTERTFEMVTETFEQERMNAHVVAFGEQEGGERKMFLIGFDEEERGMFIACQAGWPVDMSNEQVEVLNAWYQNVLDELSRRANRQNVGLVAHGNIRAPEWRRRSLTLLGALLLLSGLAAGIWALHHVIQ
jgi:hypothetical protein